jgi:hypothetical protein
VPHAVRERFVDFGLIVTEKGGAGYAGVRFAGHWREVQRLDPQADIEVLEMLEREITGQFSTLQDREILLHWLDTAYSNAIQITSAKPFLALDPEQEIELLASVYLKDVPAGNSSQGKAGGRQLIFSEMKNQFKRFAVWDLLIHGVPVAQYTKPGDPFKFDFGYALNTGEMKLFHAVSLRANVNAAVTLAARYPQIARAMRNSEDSVEPTLTAIIDDGLKLGESEIGFALGMMQDNGIRVRSVGEMPAIAATAQRELRA